MQAMSRVNDPELHKDLVTLGMVETVSVADGAVTGTRDCARGRCSVSTNSPPVKSLPGCDSRIASCSGNTCSPYRSWCRQL